MASGEPMHFGHYWTTTAAGPAGTRQPVSTHTVTHT